jgi:uncharacterized membrane protein
MQGLIRLLIKILSHNDNHAIKLRLDGEEHHLCPRCTGMLLGFFISILPILLLEIYRAPGWSVGIAGILLAIPDFLYWALTRIKLLPGRNMIRVLTGFLLGAGISLYGQAQIPWVIKIPLTVVPFAAIFFFHPILGKKVSFRKT